jgi:hypothetical protein
MTEAEDRQLGNLTRVIAKAWADEAYKQRLITDAVAVLAEEGIAVPEGVSVRVVEDSEDVRTIVLPPVPTDLGDMDDLEGRVTPSSLML